MPKYLIQGSYSGEGLKGLLKEGGSKRREAAEQSVKGLGGRLEAFYYAFGNDDFVVIVGSAQQRGRISAVVASDMVGLTRRSSNAKKEWKLPVTLSRDGQLGAAASSDMKYSISICQAIRFLGRKIVWCPCAFTRCTTRERKSNKNWQ